MSVSSVIFSLKEWPEKLGKVWKKQKNKTLKNGEKSEKFGKNSGGRKVYEPFY